MRDRKAAVRYAKAFFSDAAARQAVDAAAGDLAVLKQLFAQTPDLVTFLAHPLVPIERKREVCREHLLPVIHAEQLQLVDLLLARGRVALLPEICDLFQGLVDDYRGLVRAHVRSAAPLTESEKQRLHAALAEVFGGTPIMVATVHPELIGGVTVRVKDTLVDGSIRKSLDALGARLRAAMPDMAALDESV
jgi:F-type H+-transporting ATPase subunit delta